MLRQSIGSGELGQHNDRQTIARGCSFGNKNGLKIALEPISGQHKDRIREHMEGGLNLQTTYIGFEPANLVWKIVIQSP